MNKENVVISEAVCRFMEINYDEVAKNNLKDIKFERDTKNINGIEYISERLNLIGIEIYLTKKDNENWRVSYNSTTDLFSIPKDNLLFYDIDTCTQDIVDARRYAMNYLLMIQNSLREIFNSNNETIYKLIVG